MKEHVLTAILILSVMMLTSCAKDDTVHQEYVLGSWLVETADPITVPKLTFVSFHEGDTERVTNLYAGQTQSNSFYMRVYEPGVTYSKYHRETSYYECVVKPDGFTFIFNGGPMVPCIYLKLTKKTFIFKELRDGRVFKFKRLEE